MHKDTSQAVANWIEDDQRIEAMREAMREAELDRDFLRSLCQQWVNGLSAEEVRDYLGIQEPA